MRSKLVIVIASALLASALEVATACAQSPPVTLQDETPRGALAVMKLTPEQLDQLVTPIALYPDDLLSNILMAATYPLDLVEAARWIQDPSNALLRGDQLLAALAEQNWDPSVKSLTPFPRILRAMDDQLDWTERLGEAFVDDQAAVMDSVQRLRQRAQSAGRLISYPEATVTADDQTVSIEPSTPDVVYIPVYDPSIVYGDWPYPAFPPDTFPVFSEGATVVGLGCRWLSARIVEPLWGWHHLHWRRHAIDIDRDRFVVLNAGHAPMESGIWGRDSAHRLTFPYQGPRLRSRFGGATSLGEANIAAHGFPISPVPLVSALPPLPQTMRRVRPGNGIAPSRQRMPPAFDPFGRNADLSPKIAPRVYTRAPVRPMPIGEPSIEPIAPSMKLRIPEAPEPLGARANAQLRTELGNSHHWLQRWTKRGGRAVFSLLEANCPRSRHLGGNEFANAQSRHCAQVPERLRLIASR